MRNRVRSSFLAVILASYPCAISAGSGEACSVPVPQEDAEGLLLSFTIVEASGGASTEGRTYELATTEGVSAESFFGSRVPFPTIVRASESDSVPEGEIVTTYTYQNVGVTIAAEARILSDGKVRVHANIERSALVDSEARGPRWLEVTSHEGVAVVSRGARSKLVGLEDGKGDEISVELRVDSID